MLVSSIVQAVFVYHGVLRIFQGIYGPLLGKGSKSGRCVGLALTTKVCQGLLLQASDADVSPDLVSALGFSDPQDRDRSAPDDNAVWLRLRMSFQACRHCCKLILLVFDTVSTCFQRSGFRLHLHQRVHRPERHAMSERRRRRSPHAGKLARCRGSLAVYDHRRHISTSQRHQRYPPTSRSERRREVQNTTKKQCLSKHDHHE